MMFRRGRRVAAFANYYAEDTDVWVFGTPVDYEQFIADLERHVAGSTAHTHLPARKERGGMDVLLMPTATKAAKPFLLLHERIVYQQGRFNMELIIGGSAEGFAFLRDAFGAMLRNGIGDVDDHEHVDELDCPMLFLPAVFLNIRGPAVEWSEEAFGHYWRDCIVPDSAPSIPVHTSAASELYEMPEYEDLHCRVQEVVPASFRQRRRTRTIKKQGVGGRH